MDKTACGIVSYAGLSREELLAKAKAAFIQAQPPAPRRFETFLPLFPVELVQNMAYAGTPDARGAKVAASGFSIDPAEYHQKLHAQLPALYAEDNYSRNFDYEGRFTGRGAVTVDRAWVDHFPQYRPFMGEKLAIYLIGGGFQAVAVPECVYPRGGGVLALLEQTMHIAQRVELYLQYAKARIAAGDPYDADAFSTDYLRAAKVSALCLTQQELSRILQDLSVVRSLQSDTAGVGLYTESARMAERVNQYVPMRYACDLFAPEAVDKHTARLAQLYHADADFISDFWIPWQDLAAFTDRRTMTLDVRALCEAYQIAPRYDPDSEGGRYPDAVRAAAVRDRELTILVGGVINNPAYGDGMSPQGMIGRRVSIADSREMIRQRKLVPEEAPIALQNMTLPPDAYRRSLALSILQEHKGRLIDAMYRRETALTQIDPDNPVYGKACQLLGERVDKLAETVRRESKQSGMSQMSGYDADIDYLRRKQRNREGEPPEPTPGVKPIAFARDPQREQSIESGYAMRAGLLRLMYSEAALPEPPPEKTMGADDSEDEAGAEPLPLIPATPAKPPAVTGALPPGTALFSPKPKAIQAAASMAAGEPKPAAPQRPSAVAQSETRARRPDSAPLGAGSGRPNAKPSPAENSGEPSTAAHASETDKPCPAENAENSGEPSTAAHASETGKPCPAENAENSGEPSTAAHASETDKPCPAENTENGGTSSADEHTSKTGELCPADPEAKNAEKTDAAVRPISHTGRVSLRELTQRIQAEKEASQSAQEAPRAQLAEAAAEVLSAGEGDSPDAAQAETASPEKPKLAYILRRGSEAAASKSYNRMTELLNKRGK